ncbi:MAG: M50 family metallopeptidase [Candidatus Obscuribacterales bacterium]|nr:M50 family metallopeptidase [Candidatus Obscuribacterales bacterium]
MTAIKSISSKPVNQKTFWLLLFFAVISLLLGEMPLFNTILAPLNQFETIVHELGHAFACLMTGGSVSGLSIVSDGAGHGGLTFCHGGNPFIYGQTGYLGEAFFGGALILLARFPTCSRALLCFLGTSIALCSFYFMPGVIFSQWQWQQGLGSLAWGLSMAAGFFYAGKKLSDKQAYLLLLFVAVQSTLNSLSGMWTLLLQSFGFFPGTWSDATNMQQLTGIPSFIWGFFWSLASLAVLGGTFFLTYKLDQRKQRRLDL